VSSSTKVKITLELPENLVLWLKRIADARGEAVDEVLTWTLGNLFNLYDRWEVAIKRWLVEKVREGGDKRVLRRKSRDP